MIRLSAAATGYFRLMSDPCGGSSSLERALTGGAVQCVGWYRLYFADERWEWSEEVERIHGYEPGTVTPTTELVLSHKHPEDYQQVAATLEDILRTHKPFSTRHRIITTRGDTRDIVVIGEQFHDDNGVVIGTQGFYVDVTPCERARQSSIGEAVAQIAANRAVIEQAKGVLMSIYQISADAAFELLRWRSMDCNVKLRALAGQILKDIEGLTHGQTPPPRDVFDRLLLTAHERVISGCSEPP